MQILGCTCICRSIVNVPKSGIAGSGSILKSDIEKSATREILGPFSGSKT